MVPDWSYLPQALRRNVRWVLIAWIFLMSSVAYLDRVNISIAGQAIARSFGLSNVQLGGVFSAFLIGYALFQAPAGWLADRLGARLALMLSVVWWAIFTAAITLLPFDARFALAFIIAIRFLLGAGEAIMYPASNCIVSAWIPAEERGAANGLIFAGVGFGAGMTPLVITFIMIYRGWEATFLFSACVGLVVGGIWFLIARDWPNDHPWITREECEQIAKAVGPTNSSQKRAPLPWRELAANGELWIITASYFGFGYVAQIFFSWFFIYLNQVRGLDLKQSALYSMLPFLCMSGGSAVGGVVSDALSSWIGTRRGRNWFAAMGLFLSAMFVVTATQISSAPGASLILAGGAGSLYLAQSAYWSASAEIGGRSAGTCAGIMNMGGQIGGALTASLTPVLAARYGWNISFAVAALFAVISSIAWLLAGRLKDGVRMLNS